MAADAMHMTGISMGRFNAMSLLGSVMVLLAVLGISYSLSRGGEHAVSHLEVEGEFQHVQPSAVRIVVIEQLGEGFAALDLDAVRTAVETLPWVARARAERIWPADVRVRVWERVPIARWGDKGLLSSEAVPFIPAAADLNPSLPQLSGGAGHEREVMETFKSLSERLKDTPFALNSLSLDPRGEWTALTQSGIALHLGRENPDSKLDTLTGPVMQALGQRLQEVKYVDLRYSNGFSVAWRVPAPIAATAEENKHE
jgi:cell division protein FtsQ